MKKYVPASIPPIPVASRCIFRVLFLNIYRIFALTLLCDYLRCCQKKLSFIIIWNLGLLSSNLFFNLTKCKNFNRCKEEKRFYKVIFLSNSNIALEYWLRFYFPLNFSADLLNKVKQVFYTTFYRWLFTISWHNCQIFHIGLSARHCSLLYSEFRRFFWNFLIYKSFQNKFDP